MERAAIKRKVEALMRKYVIENGSKWSVLHDLNEWIIKRTKRTASRKGGLGRR